MHTILIELLLLQLAGSRSPSYVETHFETGSNELNQVLLNADLHGKGRATCMLDTGATQFNISDREAKSLGLVDVDNDTSRNAIGQVSQVSRYYLGEYFVGDFRINAFYAYGSNFETWVPYQAIVGPEILKSGPTEINFDSKAVILYGKSTPQPYSNSFTVPASVDQYSRMFIKLKINNVTGTFLIDTGFEGSILVKQEFMGKASEKGVPIKAAIGFLDTYDRSVFDVATMRVPRVQIGNEKLSNVPVSFPVSSTLDLQNADGIIGVSLISRFNWKFFLNKRCIEIGPRSNVNHEPFVFSRLGFQTVVQQGQIFVASLSPDWSRRSHIIDGDQIVSINGKTVTSRDLIWVHGLNQRPEGTKLKLVIRRGGALKSISLTLKDIL